MPYNTNDYNDSIPLVMDDDEFERIMKDKQSKTVGFNMMLLPPIIKAKEGSIISSNIIISVDDQYFPDDGNDDLQPTDAINWNYELIAIGMHIFLNARITSDQVHDPKVWTLNICPLELRRNNSMKQFIDHIVRTSIANKYNDYKVRIELVGNSILKELVNSLDNNSEGYRIHLERVEPKRRLRNCAVADINMQVLTLIQSTLALQPSVYSMISSNCDFCKNYITSTHSHK
jgi:hypothetical protein